MTRSDASSIDTIAALVGSSARTDLLTRTKKVSKKDVIDIARLAKDNPAAAIDAYNRGTTGKDIIVALKERLRSKMSEPFPFQIGEPVWVHAKDDRTLFPHSGFWGVVNSIYDDSCFCEVTIWSGTIKVRPENLKSCNHSPGDWAAAAAIIKRFNRLAELANEAIIVGLLQELSRRPVTVFSATEEELLSTLEKSFGLPKLESLAPSDETPNGNKRSKESNNRVVARNFLNHLQDISLGQYRAIGEAISIKKGDAIEDLLTGLASDEDKAMEIFKHMAMIYPEVLKEFIEQV